MATENLVKFTGRDRCLLGSLSFSPFTSRQLLTLSSTFAQPFTNDRYLRARMQILESRGLVRSFAYSTPSPGVSQYYKLSSAGYRFYYGPSAPLPSRAFFNPVSDALQEHTQAIAAFLTETIAAAHHASFVFTEFSPENGCVLESAGQKLMPDCRFALEDRRGRRYRFYVEIDAGTERLQSTKDIDSLERKARIYEQHQAECYRDCRYRVLFLALRGSRRVSQFLDLAAQQQSDPNRTVFYGAYLNDYLQSPDRLFSQLFRTTGSQTVSLLPTKLATKAAGPQPMRAIARLE